MKRNRKWIACALTVVLLVQSYHMAEAAGLAAACESVSENSVGEESEEQDRQDWDAAQESGTQETAEKNDVWPEETVSQNSISENSVSENSTESGAAAADDGLTEKREEQTVSENTTGESVSENTTEETVSGNTTGESVSENTTEETVSGNTTGESVSGNTTQESVPANTVGTDGMADAAVDGRASVPPTVPTIKSIVSKDTTAVIHFVHLLEDGQSTGILYEVQLTDEVNGAERMLSGKETGAVTIKGYDGKEMNTFYIDGLSVNKKYSVVLQAKYGESGAPVSSVRKTFTTKKDMLATDGSMKIRYADMEALKNDRTKEPEEITAGVRMKVGESCALYAQVSRLMRAVETDKLMWTVTPVGEDSPKNGLKVKATKSTYEAVLTAEKPGSYQVAAMNTLSKEQVASFQVSVEVQ